MSSEDIIKAGSIEVKVIVAGVRQAHTLEVKMEKTPAGEYPVLVSKHYIPNNELIRLARELGLPVRHGKTIVFPPGKMAGHFIRKG